MKDGIYGAMLGDIVGSKYEFENIKTKDFKFFDWSDESVPTDDSIMTYAVAKAIQGKSTLEISNTNFIDSLQFYGRKFPNAGFGGMFYKWLFTDDPKPYGSYGNGSAMRVSPIAYVSDDVNDIINLSELSASVSHNDIIGIRGAQCVAICIFAVRKGATKEDVRKIASTFYKQLNNKNFTLDKIRPKYKFYVSCEHSVPQAILSFLESDSLEDCIRNAISIGGDSDTIAAIAGSIAGEFYGISDTEKEFVDTKMETYYGISDISEL